MDSIQIWDHKQLCNEVAYWKFVYDNFYDNSVLNFINFKN
jgi:hypothetical protein